MPVQKGFCTQHATEAEKVRGSSSQRGYGTAHKKIRASWRARIENGGVCCSICGKPIPPGSNFHLDHNDDRSGYTGATHQACNLSKAGKSSGKYS